MPSRILNTVVRCVLCHRRISTTLSIERLDHAGHIMFPPEAEEAPRGGRQRWLPPVTETIWLATPGRCHHCLRRVLRLDHMYERSIEPRARYALRLAYLTSAVRGLPTPSEASTEVEDADEEEEGEEGAATGAVGDAAGAREAGGEGSATMELQCRGRSGTLQQEAAVDEAETPRAKGAGNQQAQGGQEQQLRDKAPLEDAPPTPARKRRRRDSDGDDSGSTGAGGGGSTAGPASRRVRLTPVADR